MAGFETNSSLVSVAKFWKNGVATVLTDGSHKAHAEAIYVSGTDVYVAGFEENTASNDIDIKYWKNGIPTILGNTTSESGLFNWGYCDISVSGNDVYVTTTVSSDAPYEMRAKVWKNGIPVTLSPTANGSASKSVFISGNDVYAAGIALDPTNNHIATSWKNGIASFYLPATSNLSYAEDIYVLGSDVYVTGRDYGWNYFKAVVWKNGVAESLSDGLTGDGYGSSIVVVNP